MPSQTLKAQGSPEVGVLEGSREMWSTHLPRYRRGDHMGQQTVLWGMKVAQCLRVVGTRCAEWAGARAEAHPAGNPKASPPQPPLC